MDFAILCGMPEEAAIARRVFPAAQVIYGTGKFSLSKLVRVSCHRIISFGLCGGLSKQLAIGDVVTADRLVDRAGKVDRPDGLWNARAARTTELALCPVYYSSGLMDEADNVLQRAAILAKYRAWAIDDESRYAAAFAAERSIAFNIFRSVSDDWSETLPLAATGAIMNSDGSANIDYLLASLAKQPGQIPQLLQIAGDFRKSLDTLEAAARQAASIFPT